MPNIKMSSKEDNHLGFSSEKLKKGDIVRNVSGRNNVFCYIRCRISSLKATLLQMQRERDI